MVADFARFDKDGKLVTVLAIYKDKYEPMQYIGLKDKNGKEVITHPLIEVKSSVKSGTWRRVGSKPVQWVFGVRSVTFQKKRSKLLREWPHDWHCADNYFHRCSASTLV